MRMGLTSLAAGLIVFMLFVWNVSGNSSSNHSRIVVVTPHNSTTTTGSTSTIITTTRTKHTTTPSTTPRTSSTTVDYSVKGSIEVNTLENSIFEWNNNKEEGGTNNLYLLENIGCSYSQHASKWFPDIFWANSSYARIRDFYSGEIVANLSSTVGYGFVTPFPDYETKQLWLFGSHCNRCAEKQKPSSAFGRSTTDHHHQHYNHGCAQNRKITAWKLLEVEGKDKTNNTVTTGGSSKFRHWQRQDLPFTLPTYNVQVTAVNDNNRTNTRYAMIAEPFTIYVHNNSNNNLFANWIRLPTNRTQPPRDVPVGGPSIRYVGGYYYVLTGGHQVELIRTKDFSFSSPTGTSSSSSRWERSPHRPFIRPTPQDAQAAPYNGFNTQAVQESRGFVPYMNGSSSAGGWTRWDWNSNDADVAYLDPNNNNNNNNNNNTMQKNNKTFIIWGAGTQGQLPEPPLTRGNHCTNVVAVANNMSLATLFERHFVPRLPQEDSTSSSIASSTIPEHQQEYQ